jgi:hypothetical protein
MQSPSVALLLAALQGGLSPVLYWLIVPARHAENVTNLTPTKYWRLPKIH